MNTVRRLHALSYRRPVLWASCLSILGVGLALGLLLPVTQPTARQTMSEEMWSVFAGHHAPAGPGPVEQMLFLSALAEEGYLGTSVSDLPFAPVIDEVFLLYQALSGDEQACQRLEQMDAIEAQVALGVLDERQGNYNRAVDRYLQVLEVGLLEGPAAELRSQVLDCVMRGRDELRARELSEDPAFHRLMRGQYLYLFHARQGNWLQMLPHFFLQKVEALRWPPLCLALATAVVWTLVLLGIRQATSCLRFASVFLLALGLGVVSTWPTVWMAWAWDEILGVHPSGEFVDALLYFCLSVGVREEGWKLLCFLPLLGFLRGSGRELDAMVLGSGVGLGFAVEENLLYFSGFLGQANASSRFLTANLLHITATGLIGLYLYRAMQNPQRWGGVLAKVVGGVVLLHGVYDTLLIAPVPGLGSLAYFAGTTLAALALFFFQELRALCPLQGRLISITAIYLWGLSSIFSLEFVLLCFTWSFGDALQLSGQAGLTSLLFVFVVLHALREPLTS